MFEDIERIIVETEEGEEIATLINDDEMDEPIIVADGYTVRIKPKTNQPLGVKMKYKSAIKEAIKELKYSIEPNQGFMECRTGTISEETIRMAIEVLGEQMHNCGECKHANYYDWCTLGNHLPLVLCREHNAMMRDDNCCRDWTPLE